jgi:hypothetical protein
MSFDINILLGKTLMKVLIRIKRESNVKIIIGKGTDPICSLAAIVET